MAQVAIIGAYSFSGSTFIKYLQEKGVSVLGFARTKRIDQIFLPFFEKSFSTFQKIEILESNVLTDHDHISDILDERNVEFIFNFAAQSMVVESWDRPEDWYDVNVSSFSKLLRRLSANKQSRLQKYIQFSTPEVYGTTSGLVKECWDFNPTTPYAISRTAGDLHLRALNNTFGFPVVFTRTANIYGKYQRLYRLIPKLIVKILKGQKFELHGGGKSIRSFIHSDDVAEALWKVMQKGQTGETYHISGTRFITILDLVMIILDKLNASFNDHIIIKDDRAGKDEAYLLDSSKIRGQLGWEDKVSLESGIDQVINWVTDNWTKIQTLDTNYRHTR